MLKIIDLNRNEDLSSSEMGKLAGGSALSVYASVWRDAGFDEIADILDPPASTYDGWGDGGGLSRAEEGGQ